MPKRAISVTLEADNLTWLRGRTGAAGARSVSELLDQLVTAARKARTVGASRSVVGTIELGPNDPSLEGADAAVNALLEGAIGAPLVAGEGRARYGARAPKRSRRG